MTQTFKTTENSVILERHYEVKNFSDRIALIFCKFLRFCADLFFQKRYGNRAIILETVAAVPGMVGGMLIHLKCLRKMISDNGWIHTLLDEAENERMHLMAFAEIIKPRWYERWAVVLVQGIFFNIFFVLYIFAPRTAHRLVGYFEEEAVISYTGYLACIDSGEIENIPAPKMAIEYWNLEQDARLRDMVIAIRLDEMNHRDVNHDFANTLDGKKKKA